MNLRHVFFSAPHRVMFLAGAVHSLLPLLWWAFDLGGRYAGVLPLGNWPLPAVWWHAVLMIYGFFPFFIFGFLMTALPKWVSMGPLATREYVPAFLMMLAGWAAAWAGLLLPPLLSGGLALAAAGWLAGWWVLFRVVRASPLDDRQHAWAVLGAHAAGALGLLAFAAGIALTEETLVRGAIELGLWGFLVPVFFIVTHRMLPFFSGSVIRNYPMFRSMPLLWVMLACFALHGAGAVLGLRAWLWLPDAVASAVAFWLSWKWQLRRSFVSHLLAMHHSAGLWLGIALLLYAVQGGLLAVEVSWGGLAPLHALTIGYCASILIGMATRVTLGHSGRLISSDVWSWRLFWVLQLVVLLRLAGDFWFIAGPANLSWLAALLWLAVFGLWCRVHVPMYLTPRPDGRPG